MIAKPVFHSLFKPLFFVVFLACHLCGWVLVLDAQEAEFKHAKQIDGLVKPFIDAKQIMGCSVGVVSKGQVWFGNYGRPSDEKLDSPTADTIYEIGSISKVFTSLMLADAVESGKLELTTTVADVFDTLKDSRQCNAITVTHLSTHVSGLPRMPRNWNPIDPEQPYACYTRADMLSALAKRQSTRSVGKRQTYSNFGAGLLGEIVAEKFDADYESVLRSQILEPLKMSDSGITSSKLQLKRRAQPYDGALMPSTNWTFDAMAGGGSILSTTRDMTKFIQANLDPSSVPIEKSLNLAWKKHQDSTMLISEMGLGWFILPDKTHFHNGQTGGYCSNLLINKENKIGVILLCNSAVPQVDQLAVSIFDTLAGKEVKPVQFPEHADVDLETVKRLAGVYRLTPDVTITVAERNGCLAAKHSNQTFLRIYPESKTSWKYSAVNAEIEFELFDSGPAPKLRFTQGSIDIVAPRIDP